MKKILVTCLGAYVLIHFFLPKASAMTNDNYSLDQDQADIIPFQQQVRQPQDQNQSPVTANIPKSLETAFTFSVSQTAIPFGALSATNPVLRNLELKIASKDHAYQLFAFENHALAANPVDMIPNTTCDNGSCTANTPSLWTNNLTYGFGYHTEDEAADTYRPFIDASKTKQLMPTFTGDEETFTKKLTYKVNISRTQKQTSYLNIVTYIATPNY